MYTCASFHICWGGGGSGFYLLQKPLSMLFDIFLVICQQVKPCIKAVNVCCITSTMLLVIWLMFVNDSVIC